MTYGFNMKINRKITVPTGTILVGQDERGRGIECLGVYDYGKESNIKADFMGLTKPIQHVKHAPMMPATEKIVVTVSSQNGCSMDCKFCDVPKVGKGTNVSLDAIHFQVDSVMAEFPDLVHGKRLNIHYARMGEPTFNRHILRHALQVKRKYAERFDTVHPVISTMMPRRNTHLEKYLIDWMDIKNEVYLGEAGLQLSINSTSDEERAVMFSGNTLPIKVISQMMNRIIKETGIQGRKITLNFALAGYEIDAEKLAEMFDPKYFICKLTPMHVTESVVDNAVPQLTPYEPYEEALKAVGFDVIVFLPSEEEDKGRITCGNALLSGSNPEVRYEEIIIKTSA